MLTYFIVIILILLATFTLFHRKRDPRLPPGIDGWPIIGRFPSLKTPLVNQVERLWRQFGDVFMWRIGSRNYVFICDPVLIKKAFTNPHLTDRPENLFVIDTRTNFKKIGILNANGETWQVHRRFALRQLRDAGFGKSIAEDVIHAEAEALIKEIKDNYTNASVALPPSVNVATLNVIMKLIADVRFEKDDEDLQKFENSLISVVKISQKYSLLDVFPWIFPILNNAVIKLIGFQGIVEERERIFSYLRSLIEKRKAVLNRENPCGLIDAYLLEIENSESDTVFNEESLLNTLLDFFLAGSDTTASSIRWFLQYLAEYPDIQKKIHNEIDSVVPRDRLPSMKDKSSLPYTEACLSEMMRLTSLVPFGLVHAASQDTTIDKYLIPKGTMIQAFLYGCHMNPKCWEKPNEFYPEHFLDENGKFSPRNDFLLPFSAGRRSCLGESLARTELFLFTSALLQKFSFYVPEGEKMSFTLDAKNVIVQYPPNSKFLIKERE